MMKTIDHHHARGREETVYDLPPLVPTRSASGKSSTCLREAGMSNRAPAEDPGKLANRNPGYSIAWRMDRARRRRGQRNHYECPRR